MDRPPGGFPGGEASTSYSKTGALVLDHDEFLLRPFTDGEHYFDVRYSVPEQIKAALGAAGMATPYPQQKLIMIKD